MAGGNSKISTGHIDSKLAYPSTSCPMCYGWVESTGIRISGLHMHTGSDILDVEVFLNACDILFGVAASFPTWSTSISAVVSRYPTRKMMCPRMWRSSVGRSAPDSRHSVRPMAVT